VFSNSSTSNGVSFFSLCFVKIGKVSSFDNFFMFLYQQLREKIVLLRFPSFGLSFSALTTQLGKSLLVLLVDNFICFKPLFSLTLFTSSVYSCFASTISRENNCLGCSWLKN